MKSKSIAYVAIFIFTLLLGLYYRTYDLRLYLYSTEEQIMQEAEDRVTDFIDRQLIPQLKEQFPGLSKEEFKKKHQEAKEQLKQRDWDHYYDRLTRTKATMPKSAAISGIYLLGADSYHYLDLMLRIVHDGKISDQVEHGRFFHPGRYTPFGAWETMTWHPHAGYYCYHIVKMFVSSIKPIEAAALFPVMMYVLILITFIGFAIYLRGSPLGILIGAISLATAPLFMQRTMFGWFDTDPYSFIFFYIVLGLCFFGVKSVGKQPFIFGALSGIFTFIFSFFWLGWPFLAVVVTGTCIIGWVVSRFRDDIQMPRAIPYLIAFISTFLVLKLIHMGPYYFYMLVRGIVRGLFQFSSRTIEGWPDMFIIVRETQSVGFKKIIEHASNNWMVGLALLGIISYAKKANREELEYGWSPWIAMILAFVGSIYLSVKTERFSLLCVIPIAILVMWGIDGIQDFIREKFKKHVKKKPWLPFGLSFLIVLGLLPVNMNAALTRLHDTDLRFFDDAWFHVLGRMEKETPKNSNVMTWWPSGYITSAVARRNVFTDGGSQHLPEAYWTARFYFAQNERDALGIVRMLNAGGNKSVEYLIEEKGIQLDKAIELIWEVIRVSRQEADKKLPKDWSAEDRKTFLDLSHGDKMPPSYALAYQDIVRKVSSVSIIARWDFEEAVKWKKEGRGKDYQIPAPKDPYLVKKRLNFPSSIVKAEKPSEGVLNKAGVYYFRNGLFWDPEKKQGFFKTRDGKQEGKPKFIYYMEDGKLKQVDHPDAKVAVAGLVFQDNGKYQSVLAAPQIIESILFRMYYLHGEGLKYFKPLAKARNPITGHWVHAFEVDWESAGMS